MHEIRRIMNRYRPV